MQYKLFKTNEAVEDVTKLAVYMIDKFKNRKAASDFMNAYDKQVEDLKYFPFGYRGISLEYRSVENFKRSSKLENNLGESERISLVKCTN